MFWALQKSLFNESAFEGLLEQLERQGQPYAVVEIKNGVMTPDINPEGPVMAMGALAMGRVAKAKGWAPGRFEEGLEYGLWLERYGDLMLNNRAWVGELGSARAPSERFFIRPAEDTKSFSGRLMDPEEFEAFKASERAKGARGLSDSDRVVLAPLKKILAEYRFFVVDGEPVTGCLYKLGSRVLYSDRVDPSVWAFAKKAAARWSPNRAFALDLAEGEEGLRVLEINAVNSASFYALDMGRFVAAIAAMDLSAELSVGQAPSGSPPKSGPR